MNGDTASINGIIEFMKPENLSADSGDPSLASSAYVNTVFILLITAPPNRSAKSINCTY